MHALTEPVVQSQVDDVDLVADQGAAPDAARNATAGAQERTLRPMNAAASCTTASGPPGRGGGMARLFDLGTEPCSSWALRQRNPPAGLSPDHGRVVARPPTSHRTPRGRRRRRGLVLGATSVEEVGDDVAPIRTSRRTGGPGVAGPGRHPRPLPARQRCWPRSGRTSTRAEENYGAWPGRSTTDGDRGRPPRYRAPASAPRDPVPDVRRTDRAWPVAQRLVHRLRRPRPRRGPLGHVLPGARRPPTSADALAAGARLFKVHVQVGVFSPLDPLLDEALGRPRGRRTPVVIHVGSGAAARRAHRARRRSPSCCAGTPTSCSSSPTSG